MLTRQTFRQHARPIQATVNGMTVTLDPKEFSTGSLGWNTNQKVEIQLANGERVRCQLGLNLTIVGSKELPKA